jgi:hypothetical protein
MANHASMRTTQLYDRRRDELTLDEIESNHDLETDFAYRCRGTKDSGFVNSESQ